MRALLPNAWLRPLVVGLTLFLGISGGSWALMHWLSASIQRQIETFVTLNVWTEQVLETVDRLKDPHWGMTLREIHGERFVVLPKPVDQRKPCAGATVPS